MNLRDLEAFLAVAETGSIVAAAAKLNLTQPAVTRRVQNLEQELDAPLLDRETKPPRLTRDGYTVQEAGGRVLRAVEELRAAVGPGAEPRGELRLGLSQAVGELALGRPVGLLRAAYPRLALKLTSGHSLAMIRDVSAGTLDAAAVLLPSGMTLPEDLEGEVVGAEDILVVAARRLAIPATPRLEDLSHHPWVLNPEGCGYRTHLQRTFERARLPFNVAVEFVGPDLQLSTVVEGFGLGLMPRSILEQSPHRASLRVVEVPELRLKVSIWVASGRIPARLAAPVARFRAAMAETLAGSRERVA